MSRMSPGERHVMALRHRDYDTARERPTEEEADFEPTPISAGKIRPGMVVSVMPTSEKDRPRKFTVRSKAFSDDVLEVDGKKVRVRRIFFNGNGAKKFFSADLLLLHFSPDSFRDGLKTKPMKADPVTSEQEKADMAAEREARRERLARIVEKYGS